MPNHESPYPAELPYVVAELGRRVDDIEAELRMNAPAVLATKIDNLAKTVNGLQTAVYTVGGGLFVAAVGVIGALLAGGH